MDRELSSGSDAEESLECCLLCAGKQGLQGVAVTIGRKTFHLFYLCTKCGNIPFEELLKMIGSFEDKKTIR